jgi:hypothetical protein
LLIESPMIKIRGPLAVVVTGMGALVNGPVRGLVVCVPATSTLTDECRLMVAQLDELGW